MFRLRDQISYSAFLQKVKKCSGEVLYLTEDGDTLNLRSALSQLLFSASFMNRDAAKNARISFSDMKDAEILSEFIIREGV